MPVSRFISALNSPFSCGSSVSSSFSERIMMVSVAWAKPLTVIVSWSVSVLGLGSVSRSVVSGVDVG